jgi:Tfp pilus assembly protein PilV
MGHSGSTSKIRAPREPGWTPFSGDPHAIASEHGAATAVAEREEAPATARAPFSGIRARHTFAERARQGWAWRQRILAQRLRGRDGEAGDTLIEVMASALMLAVIVVATFNGMSAANKATATERARSQANAIAQQDEDQLRSEPINNLTHLEKTREVTETGATYEKSSGYHGTVFTLTTRAEAQEEGGTSSCTSSAASPSANYIKTTSEVTWHAAHPGEKVVETDIISPPPGTTLIARVVNRAAEPVNEASVTASGPLPSEASLTRETAGNGCALLDLESGGTYKVNVKREHYVDENWYSNSAEDPHNGAGATVNLIDETTTKKEWKFDNAGKIEVALKTRLTSTEEPHPAQAINVVAYNSEMNPKVELLARSGTACPTNPTYTYAPTYSPATTILSPVCVFPYGESSPYAVYAGTCTANEPKAFGFENGKAIVTPGGLAGVELLLPALAVSLYTGSSEASKGSIVGSPKIFLTDTDTGTSGEGCNNEKHEVPSTKASYTAAEGALTYPGEPYGNYTVCAQWEPSAGTFASARAEKVKIASPTTATIVELFKGATVKTTHDESIKKSEKC